jgi:hypothetical protein
LEVLVGRGFQGWRGCHPPANEKKEIGIPDRHDDRNSTLGRGLRGQQAGELKCQTQSVDAQEGRFRIFTEVPGRGLLGSTFRFDRNIPPSSRE